VRAGSIPATSARRHVVMVFPDAIDRNWNDGRPGIGGGVDDVGFVRALIARIRADVAGIDPARTYATGMSNGGHMSFRLACEMPDTITAIAPVAATLSVALSQRCAPARPVSVLNILGERDPISPFAGGQIRGRRGAVMSAAQTLDFWSQQNRCANRLREDRAGPRTTRYLPQCPEGSALRTRVVQMSLADGGHTWPGYPTSRFLERIVGPTSMAINATTTIFDFFGIREQGALQ
jgi:polyhydroxybutyrate depolymerase